MQPTIAQMKQALAAAKQPADNTEKRIKIDAKGPGGVRGIVVPKHLIEGNPKASAEGLKNMMAARAQVYGAEHRDPLTLSQIGNIHKQALSEHFAKPLHEQIGAEQEALNRIRSAKFIKPDKDTLDESEKLDTVKHEHDEQGRSHVGYASKGIAGHALYPKGHGEDMDYKVINTCPGQTGGCGGGVDKNGVVDTKQGTCFAPNAESQYAAAVSRRAGHAIAKHDPAMTKDWIIAHTGSMRNAANQADKQNKRMLFRPNVVDETDVSSRHVIRHLNEQRKAENKPAIVANSYGKTNELHDPENGYYVTHSNVGPKVKKGQEITENIGRDKARVQNTIMAADNKGDYTNDQGNKTPPRGSYMVTDVKRGSAMAKKMEGAITHAKYWSRGNEYSRLSDEEREEGPEGHFGPDGKPTTPERAHYGHITLNDTDKDKTPLRFDYQKQHILHPRLVNVPERKKNKKTGEMETVDHMIPTDSRFKDEEFLPKNRYKTKNGKDAGHILMTTPTESTSNIGHQTSFTHPVSDKHIEHALANNGEYEIDNPQEQIKAKGKEYAAPQAIKFYAEGGAVGATGGRHPDLSEDDFHAFPEQNGQAQRHLAMRIGTDEQAPSKAQPLRTMAKGGSAAPTMDEMRAHLVLRKAEGGPIDIKDIGAEEAPNMAVKEYMSPGMDKISLPTGGVDFQPQMPGKQMLPAPPGQPPGMPGQPPAPGAPPQGGLPPPPPQGMPPMGAMPPGMPAAPPAPPKGPQSNILAMTPQGQAMQAMRPSPIAQPRPPMLPMKSMAKGGSTTPSVQEMRRALAKRRAKPSGSTHDIRLTERML